MSYETDSSVSSSENEEEEQQLTLNQVNEMVREFERSEKKERKKSAPRKDRNNNVGEIIVDPSMIENLKISQRQLKMLKPKKPRTEKQIESAKRMVDLRKKQYAEERAEKEKIEMLKIKVAEKRAFNKKPKEKAEDLERELKELEEQEAMEAKKEAKLRSFQARKPKLDEEIEEKVNQLKKIDDVINTNNPYYAMIMKNRLRK